VGTVTTASPRLTLGQEDVEVAVRVNRRARRIGLKVDPLDGTVVLTLPQPRLLREGLDFAQRNAGWLAEKRNAVATRVPFVDGALVPYQDRPHLIRHIAGRRGVVWRTGDDEIHVAGDAAHVSRRVRDWLTVQARQSLTQQAQEFAARIDRRVARVTVRDTRSRWGSCAASGALSFSWRLILAPAPVLSYVAAHEVAHLVHHNHGPAFWRLVADLYPDHETQRVWLSHYGHGLHRYG
jgi:predicted metal-dependent hydrolase